MTCAPRSSKPLNQLGIANLSGGLTQLDLSRILQALGLGQSVPPA